MLLSTGGAIVQETIALLNDNTQGSLAKPPTPSLLLWIFNFVRSTTSTEARPVDGSKVLHESTLTLIG